MQVVPKPETPFGEVSQFYEAFSSLYPRLVSYGRRYGATYPEDIAQEAFVILMQRVEPVEHPTAFLYGTVRTLSLTERRPMKNQNLSLEVVLEPGKGPEAEQDLLHREVRERLVGVVLSGESPGSAIEIPVRPPRQSRHVAL